MSSSSLQREERLVWHVNSSKFGPKSDDHRIDPFLTQNKHRPFVVIPVVIVILGGRRSSSLVDIRRCVAGLRGEDALLSCELLLIVELASGRLKGAAGRSAGRLRYLLDVAGRKQPDFTLRIAALIPSFTDVLIGHREDFIGHDRDFACCVGGERALAVAIRLANHTPLISSLADRVFVESESNLPELGWASKS